MTSTTTQPNNFNQPQSLVKYSNPVLVSSTGKKPPKVVLNIFDRIQRSISKIYLIHTPKTSLILFYLLDSIQPKNNSYGIKSNNLGFNQFRLHQQPNKMFLICRKSLTKDFNKDRHDKLVFVPFDKNYIPNVLMNLFVKSQ